MSTSELGMGFGAVKFVATLPSSAYGMPGGIFSPSLAVGARMSANIAASFPGVATGAVILMGIVSYSARVARQRSPPSSS